MHGLGKPLPALGSRGDVLGQCEVGTWVKSASAPTQTGTDAQPVYADIVHDTGVDGYLKNQRFLAAWIDSASAPTSWQRTGSATLLPGTKVLLGPMAVKSRARF